MYEVHFMNDATPFKSQQISEIINPSGMPNIFAGVNKLPILNNVNIGGSIKFKRANKFKRASKRNSSIKFKQAGEAQQLHGRSHCSQ